MTKSPPNRASGHEVPYSAFVDAVDKGKVDRITVAGYEVGGDVFVTVSDSGPGIPRQYADKIFDIYFTTREDEGGTGLGLYMTRAIVEDLFRGTVQLTERKPGTTFEIRIPIAESQENHRD